MGKSKDLTKEEKGRIVQLLSNGLSSLEIAKEMHRDNRTHILTTHLKGHHKKFIFFVISSHT